MYQKQVSSLIGEISSLAVEVTLAKKAIVFVRYSAHVDNINIDVCDPSDYKQKLYSKDVWFEGLSFQYDRAQKEAEALQGLHEIKLQLQKYLNINPFYSTWEQFKEEIEQEIVDCIRNARPYNEENLFHDVMIETTGHEISLDCVYQSLKLTQGEEHASLFKKEMLDNIQWLDRMVHMNGSEYEKEVV